MLHVINNHQHLFPPPDSCVARASFLLSGGIANVVAAGKRREGWQFKFLLVITALAIVIGVVKYSLDVSLAFGLSIGLTGLFAVSIGNSIFSLAQESLYGQLKAGRTADTADATSQFETWRLCISLRVACLYISALVSLLRIIFLRTLERVFEGLSGLTHIAFSQRLLPSPLWPR